VTRDEWPAARKQLLAREKEFTRQRGALNAERRRLPVTVAEKDYRFEGPDGEVRLAGLPGGCSQLIIRHVMSGPGRDTICPGCNASLNALPAGILAQLRTRDTAYAAVSRAPASKIAALKAANGRPAGTPPSALTSTTTSRSRSTRRRRPASATTSRSR